jgi:hypothetical protein
MTIFFPETALDAVARYADEREEAERAARRLMGRLSAYDRPNRRQLGYYTGEHSLKDLGISTPPSMRDLPVVAGWPALVVDTLEERLDLLGWQIPDGDDDELQLAQIFAANNLDTESSLGHLDALIYGIAFAVIGTGDVPLITVESPSLVTVTWDAQRRMPDAAVVAEPSTESFGPTRANVYLPGRRLLLERPSGTEAWEVVDRQAYPDDEIVPVVPLVNRPHASAYQGRSEITRPVRYLTDAAIRTLLGAEVNREFYAAPQRWAMGASEESFVDSNQARVGEWQAIMGRVWAIERDDDGNVPSVGQFPASSPSPFIEQIKLYAQLLAAQAGMPAAYLGFVTDNPSSADAIRAGEARLVKRAERRQAAFGQAWARVARLAILLRDGEIPPEADAIRSRWRDAATPTRAAAADEASKLVGSGILPADSQVTYDRIGLTPGEQDLVQAESRRKVARETTRLLLAGQPAAPTPPPDGLS